MTRTAGNLIFMTLICVVIFIAVMAVRPAPAAELSRQMLGSWCGQWSYQFPYSEVAPVRDLLLCAKHLFVAAVEASGGHKMMAWKRSLPGVRVPA
jgi:hypothetical protein